MDRKELTHRLYISSDNRDADMKLANLVLRLFDINGWERPKEPFGSHNVIDEQFYINEDAPKGEPKVHASPAGHWGVIYPYPHPADPQAW
jgi:hypothetical protein